MIRKVIIVSASRAEKGLLKPVMNELQNRQEAIGDIQPIWYEFNCEDFPHKMLRDWEAFLKNYSQSNTMILFPTDRPEMTYLASYAFNNGFLICHFHAGDFGSEHPDEMNRRAISCFSHILFCNDLSSQTALWRLGEERWRTFCVGSTAFDFLEIDESWCPSFDYDLVLLHPDPISEEATRKDVKAAFETVKDSGRAVVWLAPNHDRHYEVIVDFVKSQFSKDKLWAYYTNLPRSQFLGLLKNCQCCVGNSSSFTYELPYINPKAKLIKIGLRNKDRNQPSKIAIGGSKKIAEILATIPLDDKLRRKRLVV